VIPCVILANKLQKAVEFILSKKRIHHVQIFLNVSNKMEGKKKMGSQQATGIILLQHQLSNNYLSV
jgi:CRISPR/Cas system CMR-associated protein Cmr5 small subunit